jgi:tetratricopeptide (TPR) repeat protein
MRFRKLPALFVWLCSAAVAPVRAQEPLNPPVPLRRPPAAGAMSSGAAAVSLASAQRAQELGMSSVAAGLYRQLLVIPGADRAGLTLALASTLLDAGLAAAAEQALAADPGPHGAAWHLRAGLAAAQLKKLEGARAEQAAIRADELSKPDLAWYWFLQGVLFDLAPVSDSAKALESYTKAQAAAPTELARTRFQLAVMQVRLPRERPSKESIETVFTNYRENQGKGQGYEYARTYAVMLAADERSNEAVVFLQQVLLTLPAAEREWTDEFQLLVGFIGDRTRSDGAGRRQLFLLLENGNGAERQRKALQLLADASKTDATRAQFGDELDKLIALKPAHRILEALLLCRAQVALGEKKYTLARDRAEQLLRDFPGSSLRVYAYAAQTTAAWEIQSYRIAAVSAGKAHDELKAGTDAELTTTRAWLGVLKAEAYFRAGDTGDGNAIDYRNAADAYEAALKERPAGVPAEDLMFQRVLAEIRAGSLDKALLLLDEMAHDPVLGFGTENRWQAEWILARALQVQGKAEEAYGRVNQLLAEKSGSGGAAAARETLPAELRARMTWLQARLSFDTKHPDQTLILVDKLAEATGALEPALKADILSTAALLKAEAEFALGGAKDSQAASDYEKAALEILKKLRDDYPKSDAAISSYLVEAEYYAGRDQIDQARKSLKELAGRFPESSFAPHAQFQAALLAERLGQTAGYEEANLLLVDLVAKYPQSDLVFAAQLREGRLLMKLNQYPQAQRVFQELVNKYSQDKDVTLAQLALAQCINAQSTDNPALLELAKTKFGDLRDRVDAPVEVRVEAGYNLGEVLVRRGNPDEALIVWWSIVDEFLTKRSADELGTKGCYWITRALVRSGEEDWKLGKLEEAKVAWSYVVEKQLPFASIAKAKLADVGVREAKP